MSNLHNLETEVRKWAFKSQPSLTVTGANLGFHFLFFVSAPVLLLDVFSHCCFISFEAFRKIRFVTTKSISA